MSSTLLQMTVLIGFGVLWRGIRPAGLPAEQVRLVLTSVVFYLMLPALILNVLWRAEIGMQSMQFTVLGVASNFFGMLSVWLCSKVFRFTRPQLGSIMLAASFPNVTYLGLPVLEQTFGEWARSVAIQLDLFAGTPMLFTAGILIARHYGRVDETQEKTIPAFFNVPPFWAAGIAVALNLNQVEAPLPVSSILQRLSDGVVPLMLFSLGLALDWRALRWGKIPHVLPVVIIKMLLMPLFAVWLAGLILFEEKYRAASVLEMAMPSMVLGIVFCDRYRLDSSLYAMAVTLTTALSLIALPLWYDYLIR
ncbi:MAG: AEC family transporter [Gammaproteobacteria bacterium]